MPSERDLIWCELLVLRCRRGDAGAPAELVGHFQRAVLYYIRRLVGGEADAWDVSQETWLAVFKHLNRLREPRALPAFIYRTARNAAYAHLRRKRLLPNEIEPDELPAGDDDSAADALIAREDAARLHAALGTLSLAHRDVLTLHFLQELSLEQIAEVVGVPVGTLKSRIFHAKRLLREALEGRHA